LYQFSFLRIRTNASSETPLGSQYRNTPPAPLGRGEV